MVLLYHPYGKISPGAIVQHWYVYILKCAYNTNSIFLLGIHILYKL